MKSLAIALVLAFGMQAPAQSTAGRRTPVEIRLVSWGRPCDAIDPDFIAGFESAFSVESLAISGSTLRLAVPNRFRRAHSGVRAAVNLLLTLRYEGSEAWDRPLSTDTTTSNHDEHLLITGSIDRRHQFWTTTHRFRSRLCSGDMDRGDFCWRSGRNIGLVALEALHRDCRALSEGERLALMPIVRMHTETEWLPKEAHPKRERYVLTDTTLAFHWKPGVWFMLLRVDCDREDGFQAVITDPNGKVLCPLQTAAQQVANKCDCMGFGMGPREGAHGWSFVSASSWNPRRGPYRIQVKGLAPCRVVVSGGAQFSRNPHWGAADTLSIGPGEELVWTANWGDVAAGDSTRVTVRRVGSSNP